jgi:uncharacterized protein (TIGR03790 family)
MKGSRLRFWLTLCGFFLLAHIPLLAEEEPQTQGPDLVDETIVLFNERAADSRQLAFYYAKKRQIAEERVIGLDCPEEEEISREQYETSIRRPLLEKLFRTGWWKLQQTEFTDPNNQQSRPAMTVAESEIKVCCVIRGIPLKIRREQTSPKPAQEDEACVDSELCSLGLPKQTLAGPLRNPFYKQPMRFQLFPAAAGMLLVGRLDGPDTDTVKRMIDDALAAEKEGLRGRAVIDLAQKTGAYKEGEDWLAQSAVFFREHGVPVYIDREESLIPDHWPLPDTAFYFGWYAGAASGAVASPSFRFAPGAIACHLHSYSASTLRSTDQAWLGPLLHQGATAAMGNVYEPYLSLTVHFDQLNRLLLEGYTVAEAAWNATPALSWMNVVCTDPLYRPYSRGPGAVMGEEGRMRDYALYQGLAYRHEGKPTSVFKTGLTEMAETRKKPHLLELTGILSASEGQNGEAIDLLRHAEKDYVLAADKARVLLYLADLLRRENQPVQAKTALKRLLEEDLFKDVPARQAAAELEKRFE